MAQKVGIKKRLFLSFLFLTLLARFFTGAPSAETNFIGLISEGSSWSQMTHEVVAGSQGVFGPSLQIHSDATPTPPKSAEYKLYKKYLPPDQGFQIKEFFQHTINQFIVSIESTSYYIKDLTLRSLHSNSPPSPISTLFVTVLIYFFIRIGDFGIYGEIKNNGDRRFSFR